MSVVPQKCWELLVLLVKLYWAPRPKYNLCILEATSRPWDPSCWQQILSK